MPPTSCPKCGSEDLLRGVREPSAELRASVCAACGFSEHFVIDPAAIAERWRAGER